MIGRLKGFGVLGLRNGNFFLLAGRRGTLLSFATLDLLLDQGFFMAFWVSFLMLWIFVLLIGV